MRVLALSVLALLTISLNVVVAQETQQPTIEVSESSEYGAHLVDSTGASLYLYQADEQGAGTSACAESCTRNWPPFTIEGEPVAGEGVDPELIGTITRDDGSVQVTYNGWPLYRYARDTAPGDTKGAGLGGVFFLVSATGESLTEPVAQEQVQLDEAVFEELMAQGESAFAGNCAVCHGAEGQGVVGPALAGNDFLASAPRLVRQILNGSPAHGMPPFSHLSNDQIASIATYVRNSWGNDFGGVSPEMVEENR